MSESEDPRMNHIKNTTLKLLNVNDNLWADLIWKEENQAAIIDFLEAPVRIYLLFFVDQNERLLLFFEFPSTKYIPLKIAYFFKNNSVVSSENFKQEIMYGSVCNLPLNQYKKLFEMALCPIFSHSVSNNRWPAEVANNIILHIQDFEKISTYHVGKAQNKTILIIPEIAKSLRNYDINKMSREQINLTLHNVIKAITDMICDWIPIIKEVLDETSECILLKVQQGPASELLFWKNRKKKLEFIQEQLSGSLIEKMICVLRKIGSVHYSLFKNLLQDNAEALTEASEINESLSAMSDQLKKLEACEFIEIKEDLFETVKIMTSSWISSKYFSKVPSRISVLIQKLCFFIMQKVEDYLKPFELFKGKVLQMKNKVEICKKTSDAFLQSYIDCQEFYKQDNKIYPWIFPDKRIFNSFEAFVERLNKVCEIFEASVLYCSIPDYNFFGVSQVPFKMRLDKLSDSFKEYYQVFVESAYNPLNLKSNEFLEDYCLFSKRVDELDYKLGTALFQACLSYVTSEESFKFMKLVENLLKRPLVNLEFRKQITSLSRNIYMELLAAKENYITSLARFKLDRQIIYKNLPIISGKLQWSIDLQNKLSFSMDTLQHIQQYCIEEDNSELILRTHKEMQELLQKFQVEVFSTWENTLNLVKEQLNEETLFISYEQILLLNFASQIINTAQELQYMSMLEKTDLLPPDDLELHTTIQSALRAHILLAYALRWYNNLAESLTNLEKMLIKDEWEKVCQYLKKGLHDKWTKIDINAYSENVYIRVKLLYEKINEARKNVKEVQEFIETWNKSPVFVREVSDSIVNFEMFMTPKMHQQIYDVIETSTIMNKVMEENMLLFECNPESDQWKNYALYLDSIIENSLKDSIQCSLQYLAENTNRFNMKLTPFYKIRMILEKEIKFVPSLNRNQLGSFFQLFESVLERIYAPAAEIKCLANFELDYFETIVKDSDLTSLKDQVSQNIEYGINNAQDCSADYQLYSDIWLEDIDKVLEDFILYGPLHETKYDEEAELQSAEESLEIKPPTEEEFKVEINKFDMIQKKIEEIPNEVLVVSWLIIDTITFKDSLSSLVRNWSTAYKKKFIELKSQDKLRKQEYDRD